VILNNYGYIDLPLFLDFPLSTNPLGVIEKIPDPKFWTTLTITAASEITPGNYEIEVAGYLESKDGPQVQKFITVNVLESESFTFDIIPKTKTFTISPGVYKLIPIEVKKLSGTPEKVALTTDIDQNLDRVLDVDLREPNKFAPDPSFTTHLYIKAEQDAKPGIYKIPVTGTSMESDVNPVTKYITVKLGVPFTYDVILGTKTVDIRPGETKTISIDVVKASGFPEEVNLFLDTGNYGSNLLPDDLIIVFADSSIDEVSSSDTTSGTPNPKFFRTIVIHTKPDLKPDKYTFELHYGGPGIKGYQEFITVNVDPKAGSGIITPSDQVFDQQKVGTISKIKGYVAVERDGKIEKLSLNSPLYPGDKIRTGPAGTFVSDFGTGKITLRPNSSFKLPDDSNGKISVELIQGKILSNFQKFCQNCEIVTPKARITVWGTEFVTTHTAGLSTVDVIEGTVKVTSIKSGTTKVVNSKQRAIASDSSVFVAPIVGSTDTLKKEFEFESVLPKDSDDDRILIKEKVPTWIKNNAKWWADGQIGDSDFTGGIEHMIKEKIIDIPDLPPAIPEEKIPKPTDDLDKVQDKDVPQSLQSYNVRIEVPKLWKHFDGFDQFPFPERTYYSSWSFTWQNIIRLGLIQDAGKTINLGNPDEVRNYFEEQHKQWCSDTQENPFLLREPDGMQGHVSCLEIKDFTFKEVTVDGLEAYQVSYEWKQKWRERDGYTEVNNWMFWGNLIPYGDDLIIVDGETLSQNTGRQKGVILDTINSFEILNDSQPIFDKSEPLLDTDTSKQDQTPLDTDKNLQEKIPDWIKKNAKWWADGLISEDDFISGIKWLVENRVIRVS